MVTRHPGLLLAGVLIGLLHPPAEAGLARRQLEISYRPFAPAGRTRRAIMVNGSIPAPTLEFTVGDDIEIHVRNNLDQDASIHWHGLLLPNRQDGVPYLTTPPILAGKNHVFRFPAKHAGTYWYHSHTGLQEQRGVYGAIVVHPETRPPDAPRDVVVVLSDWTDEKPEDVLRNLKRGSEWYAAKKGTRQHLLGALRRGRIGAFLRRAWVRMLPMDISDVGYDAFLANGRRELSLPGAPGEPIRLRVVNAAASTYFYLQGGEGPLEILAADGTDVVPTEVDRLLIAIAETYDLLVTIPEGGALELRATAQDGSGQTTIRLGEGTAREPPRIPRPDMYARSDPARMPGMRVTGWGMVMEQGRTMDGESLDPGHSMGGMSMDPTSNLGAHPPGHDGHEMHLLATAERPVAPYDKLRSLEPSTLPPDRPWREYTFALQEDMERYVWQINGQVLDEADVVPIRRGENVRFILVNQTGMHHPMHLHGHFFRVVNQHGERSPWKHTVDIPPMGKQVIEFAADEEKDWFFHCHVLYHMMAGMARVISYEESLPDPDIAALQEHFRHDAWYDWGEVSLLGDLLSLDLEGANTRRSHRLDARGSLDGDFEVELAVERYSNRFWKTFYGLNAERSAGRVRPVGIVGFRTVLPLNVDLTFWVDTEGEARASTVLRTPLTRFVTARWLLEYDTRSGNRWELEVSRFLGRDLSLTWRRDSEYGAGLGLTKRF